MNSRVLFISEYYIALIFHDNEINLTKKEKAITIKQYYVNLVHSLDVS